VASTLVGHHLPTSRLLEEDLLSDNARIIIAGSEAAIEAQLLMEAPAKYNPYPQICAI
jgi:hypothetical protein